MVASDLINRSDAIEAIEEVTWYHQNRNKEMVSGANSDEHQAWYKAEDVYKALEEVPSADRPQEWIPCSERLPKENTEVLMSLEWGVDIGEYRNGEWHSEWINHYDDGNVLAWMPLPKPWKGADDERP